MLGDSLSQRILVPITTGVLERMACLIQLHVRHVVEKRTSLTEIHTSG